MKVVDILQRVVESVSVTRGERESESVRMRETKMKEINGKEHESNHVSSADARVRHLCGSVKAINADTNTPVHTVTYTHIQTHTAYMTVTKPIYIRGTV